MPVQNPAKRYIFFNRIFYNLGGYTFFVMFVNRQRYLLKHILMKNYTCEREKQSDKILFSYFKSKALICWLSIHLCSL